MATPHSTMFPVPPSGRNSIDLKANGEVSRMRNHKGNMPSLPQTKCCSICPAKFTRTTHLNRHLRSHTNERLHRCTTCHAEFTRSDLLTRHKRTCGDTINANRSRRKSCQSCAESKVKCDLQYPCSKCLARGKGCVFINDPEASRNKRLASQKAAQRSKLSRQGSEIGADYLPGGAGSSTPDRSSSVASPASTFSALDMPSANLFSSSGDAPGLSNSSSSSNSSPRLDGFEPQQPMSAFGMVFDSMPLDSNLNNYACNQMLEPFLGPSFSSSSSDVSNISWMDVPEFSYDGFSYPPQLDEPNFDIPLEYSIQGSVSNNVSVSEALSLNQVQSSGIALDSSTSAVQSQIPSYPPADLEQYLFLFFSSFSVQVPLLHLPTWQAEGKPQVLIRAMQACGALFVKNQAALDFITETLASSRDVLMKEFTKNSSDVTEQIHLVLAVVLLQTIGLFHQTSDQRVTSNLYHGMLVMVIRRIGLIERIGSWTPPNLVEGPSLESAWKEWASYETIKRALFLAYLHDCCHCIYFSSPPSFHPTEFGIGLPCDDGLWKARHAQEWAESARAISPFGITEDCLAGTSMQRALSVLAEPQMPSTPFVLNPFSQFLLIHTILRDLHAPRADSSGFTPAPQCFIWGTVSSPTSTTQPYFSGTQSALRNWLQIWLNSPESKRINGSFDQPPFIYNALPFYWLAQASLFATQDGISLADTEILGRSRLMKGWLNRIQYHLRSEAQIPTHLWDELMKVRAQIVLEGQNGANVAEPGGVLAVFL